MPLKQLGDRSSFCIANSNIVSQPLRFALSRVHHIVYMYRGRRNLISLYAGLPYARKLTGLDATVAPKITLVPDFLSYLATGSSLLTMKSIY